MGRHSGKKRFHPGHQKSDFRDFSVADTLQSVKRRRLSEDSTERRLPEGESSAQPIDFSGNNGWQTVTSKSSKRRNKQLTSSSNGKGQYPGLSFDYKVTRPISIEQLRDLALYILADGTGPSWVAINDAKGISKVVTMMVPGLDDEALERTRILTNKLRKRQSQKDGEVEKVKPLSAEDDGVHLENGISETHDLEFDDRASRTNIDTEGIEDFLDLVQSNNIDWLLNDKIPVKAPGDSKYSKVHSPLQAMLMVPETPDKTTPKQASEKQFKSILTPITYFVHSADELREAEYPIHPACFTSAADADLESSRRISANQSTATGWIDSEVTESLPQISQTSLKQPDDFVSQGLHIYAIDCEMVLTSDQKSSLARISVVSWPQGNIVIDKYVKPSLPIENYFTQYSGITPEILENVTTTLSDVQQELSKILTAHTILLGHSLESDLNALKMTHPFIIDTSMLYPHPRGLPLRSSLKFLANKYLRREIQSGGAKGHNSIEDSRAVLDLVRLKCEKGPKFGTTEANGEPIFKSLSKHTRGGRRLTSAIVEYGSSPERGLGKDATYAIGCQNDDDMVTGMLRAVNGDEDGKEIPYGGVDFVWGRLRALEFERGWVTNNNANVNANANTVINAECQSDSETVKATDATNPESAQLAFDITVLKTLRHIAMIHHALPRTTLLIIYNGISDVRPVLKLQAMQSQYRKEFKVKKWDELTVRWTDTEEQALRNAVEKARLGWGWVGVV